MRNAHLINVNFHTWFSKHQTLRQQSITATFVLRGNLGLGCLPPREESDLLLAKHHSEQLDMSSKEARHKEVGEGCAKAQQDFLQPTKLISDQHITLKQASIR